MIDAAGVGIGGAAAPFLTLFLVNLGATNLQIGFLASMPAIAGLVMALAIGQIIQNRANLTGWASFGALGAYSGYFFTGLLPFIVPQEKLVLSILVVWGFVTIPQTLKNVTYPAMVNSIGGEVGRFEFTTRRWSFLGFITTILTAIVGLVLERLNYPFNYQIVFMILSLGGLISFFAVRQLKLGENSHSNVGRKSLKIDLRDYLIILKDYKEFTIYIIIRFIHHLGATLLAPIISLYYIREIGASAVWIGIFSTTATAAIIIGYFLWLRSSKRINYQKILLLTTFVVSMYPLILSFVDNEFIILGLVIISGIFQAGIDLVFFDGLMKIIPADKVPIFISINVLFQYLASFIGPLLGTYLAEFIGLSKTLIFGSGIKFVAFVLFANGAIRQLIKLRKLNRIEN